MKNPLCLHASIAIATVDPRVGVAEAAAVFTGEPWEHQLIFRRAGDAFAVAVWLIEDWATWGMDAQDRDQVVLAAVCPPTAVGEQMVAALDRVVVEFGVAGYRDRWGEHDCPGGCRGTGGPYVWPNAAAEFFPCAPTEIFP